LVYSIISGIKNRAERKGKPVLNIMFIYNMPFRGLAKGTGGIVDMEMAKAILFIFNGHFFRGTGRLIRAFFRKRKAVKATAQLLDIKNEVKS
jgi:beta-glucosidase